MKNRFNIGHLIISSHNILHIFMNEHIELSTNTLILSDKENDMFCDS